MKIKKISLKNFKCFKEVDIDFKKITVLTGGNSSGKSSLLYSILSPLQSEGFPITYSPNGKYVNMGDFKEISHNNLKSNKVSLDYVIETDEDDKHEQIEVLTTWIINPKNQQPKLYSLECVTQKYNLKIHIKAGEYVFNLQHLNKEEYLGSKDFEMNKALAGFLEDIGKIIDKEEKEKKGSNRKKKTEISAIDAFLNIDDVKNLKIKRIEDLFLTLRKKNLSSASRSINDVQRRFSEIERHLGFINSFRLFPERTYYQMTKSDYKVGGYGENYIDQILRWYENKSVTYKGLIADLRSLDLLNGVDIKKLDGGRFELRVQAKPEGPIVSIADVGFGISQFLPILVADRQLPKGSTLLVAQPEIHLHPNVQAKLADYFSRQVKSKEKRYIIETHSEYFLNRLRLLITKGEIAAEDVAVYYFENTSTGTTKYSIEFSKDGQIKNAPKGFFETYMMDVMDIALHAE
ncbi:MAG: DUF3696 domain-containing protein [Anaerolineales bacterium]|nr:DUF3696 domain-containing protein [Anaerolineales bacterium]